MLSAEDDERLIAALGPAAAGALHPLLDDMFGARFHRPGADGIPRRAELRIPHPCAIRRKYPRSVAIVARAASVSGVRSRNRRSKSASAPASYSTVRLAVAHVVAACEVSTQRMASLTARLLSRPRVLSGDRA
jgi:hypothetical protein